MRLLEKSLLCSLLLLICMSVVAQSPGVTASTVTPYHGVGHDYIRLLSETVDSGSGSLSMRFDIPYLRGED